MTDLMQLIVFSCILFVAIPVLTRAIIAGLDAIERRWKRYVDARERRKRDAEWEAFWNEMTDTERAKWERFADHLVRVVNASGYSVEDINIGKTGYSVEDFAP